MAKEQKKIDISDEQVKPAIIKRPDPIESAISYAVQQEQELLTDKDTDKPHKQQEK